MEEVVLQTKWGTLVALYLFLGGLAAGTLVVSAVINLKWKERFAKTVRFGAWAGTICLVLGVLLLVAETSMPFRAMMLWQSFTNFSSWMMIGAWLLVAGVIIAGLYALSSTKAITDKLGFLVKAQKILAILAIPVSLCIALYTGILLGVLEAHPLWNTPVLPILFTVSALDTGVALILGFVIVRETKKKVVVTKTVAVKEESGNAKDGKPAEGEVVAEKSVKQVVPEGNIEDNKALVTLKATLEKATAVLVILELVVLAVYLVMISGQGGVAAASVEILITGALAPFFWILFVFCGLAVPLMISALLIVKHKAAERTRNTMSLIGIVCCLVGGCTLRFLILLAGLPISAVSAAIG